MTRRALLVALLVATLTGSAADAKSSLRSGTEVGPPHTTTAFDPSKGCLGDGPVAAQGWCSYYDGATSGTGGKPVELAAVVCRLPGQETHSLQVDDGRQADFSVSPAEDNMPFWIWSKGHRFSPYGTIFNLTAGSCLRWHVTWNVVDGAGQPLAPGLYNLIARAYAYPPGSVRVQAYVGEVYFTVT